MDIVLCCQCTVFLTITSTKSIKQPCEWINKVGISLCVCDTESGTEKAGLLTREKVGNWPDGPRSQLICANLVEMYLGMIRVLLSFLHFLIKWLHPKPRDRQYYLMHWSGANRGPPAYFYTFWDVMAKVYLNGCYHHD